MSILSNARKYLTPNEVELLLNTAKQQRPHGFRNFAVILMAYRHGLRVSELVAVEWSQMDLTAGTVACLRLKNGVPSVHPLSGIELRALRRLKRDCGGSRHVFLSE